MTTARQLITGCLKSIGVLDPSESLSADDAADGRAVLNDLVDAWNNDNLYLFSTIEVVATFAGATATIGPGMTVNTPRPTPSSIVGAFFRRGSIDYQIRIIDKEEYDQIPLKTTATGFPDVLYYDGNVPTGIITLYPVSATATEYHLTFEQQLLSFADLDTDYALAQGYARALRYSLAEEMAPLHSREPSATVSRLAAQSRRALRRANATAPIMVLEPLVDNVAGGRLNILSNRG